LTLGLRGHWNTVTFEIVGRAQYQHAAGGRWDEWYAHFSDGHWGWIAEAQGRFYLTFHERPESALPKYEALPVAAQLTLKDASFTVAEKGIASAASAAGELPYRLVPAAQHAYADLAGPDQRFATIDYSDDPPSLYLGREVTLAELGLASARAATASAQHVKAIDVACPQCGAPLPLAAPDRTERVVCRHCNALLDCTQGKLSYLRSLEKQGITPDIPLGRVGTIDNQTLTVIGYARRSVTFDIIYTWDEYLLYSPAAGFVWLVCSDNHWSVVRPAQIGEIQESGDHVVYKGQSYKKFQDARARVEYVLGEFYWKIEPGESVLAVDYVAPPYMLSKEVAQSDNATEVAWSHGTYVTHAEVARAFSVDLSMSPPQGVAPNQPFTLKSIYPIGALLLVVALVGSLLVHGRIRHEQVLTQSFTFDPVANQDATRIVFSDPIPLGAHRNVQVALASPELDNEWAWIEGDLVDEESGRVVPFSSELSYYHGYEDGESWSEGSTAQSVLLSAPPAGFYTLRLEAQWEHYLKPITVQVKIDQGITNGVFLLIMLVAIGIVPLIVLIYQRTFEVRRWSTSDFSPYGSSDTSGIGDTVSSLMDDGDDD
jgi:hypothetical protein